MPRGEEEDGKAVAVAPRSRAHRTAAAKELAASNGATTLPPTEALRRRAHAHGLTSLSGAFAMARAAAPAASTPAFNAPPSADAMTPQEQTVYGIAWGVDDDYRPRVPFDELLERNRRAADELKVEIPTGIIRRSYLSPDMINHLKLLVNDLSFGQRGFGLKGDPGSGKNMLMRMLAEVLHRPLVEIDVGSGRSLQDELGGEGLLPHEFRDEDGKLLGVVNISGEVQGRLTRAMEQPSVIVLNEVGREAAEQLLGLHDAIGSGLGSLNSRQLTINSPSGQTKIDVHPDCVIALTWNPGAEGDALEDSTMSRLTTLIVDYGTPEEEAHRYAAMVKTMVEDHPDMPELDRIEVTPEMMRPIANFAERCMERARTTRSFSSTPAPRSFARFAAHLILHSAWSALDPSIDEEKAIRTAQAEAGAVLRGLFNTEEYREQLLTQRSETADAIGGARIRIQDLIDADIQEMLVDDKKALDDLVRFIRAETAKLLEEEQDGTA